MRKSSVDALPDMFWAAVPLLPDEPDPEPAPEAAVEPVDDDVLDEIMVLVEAEFAPDALINEPTSTLRAVTMPSNGARTFSVTLQHDEPL